MKRSVTLLFALFVAVVLSLALTTSVNAQEKKAKSDESRVSGAVHMINKDTSTITVRERRTNVQRQVVYNAQTKFTYQNKPGSLDDVKDGRRVICLGKFDEKTRLVATRVDVREGQ
jgi:hypothetical protein